jgi:hypothetical protein
MNRRGFLKKLGLAAGATATALVVPDWLAEIPKGRSMISVPSFNLDRPFVKFKMAVDAAVRHDESFALLHETSEGGFLVPEGFEVELIRPNLSEALMRDYRSGVEAMIRDDLAASMAASVEEQYLKGTSTEKAHAFAKEMNSIRIDEFKKAMEKFSEAALEAAMKTDQFRLSLEKVKSDLVPVRTGILRRGIKVV